MYIYLSKAFNKFDYDTVSGIRPRLLTYGGLLSVAAEREEAFTRREKLNEYIIFGKLRLDTAGNVMLITEPAESSWADGHDVLTEADATALMLHHLKGSRMVSTPIGLPTEDALCPCCHKGWGLTNFTDFHSEQGGIVVDLHPFIGRTLDQVFATYQLRTDAIYIMGEWPLRNNKYITPDNKNGSRRKKVKAYNGDVYGDFDTSHRIEWGDEGYFITLTLKHHSCHDAEIEREVANEFDTAFQKAGFACSQVEKIPNEYGSQSYSGPWFIVRTGIGPFNADFKIGWRKRVIHLEWLRAGDLTHQAIADLFQNEHTTLATNYIHCDGYDKLQEYLTRISEKISCLGSKMDDDTPIEKVHDDLHEQAHESKERWILGVALTAALLAAMAAVANSFSAHHESHGVLDQIQASDQWTYYQAKGIKGAIQEERAENLRDFGKNDLALAAENKAREYGYEQYDIKSKATEFENASKQHMRLHSIYANGVTFAQIAIAISAISVLSKRKTFWYVGIVFGCIALSFVIRGIIG